KLYDGGVLNEAIWEIIGFNVRVPGIVLGDLKGTNGCLHGRSPVLHGVARALWPDGNPCLRGGTS
ncbi:hydantoinase B/oxoprolinase family protein, partial [Mesorhizobium sp. M3A.F.Ca.ET.175.01.1.1]|uniref:hydantoinase B/oxoprolinase family protein n=1 Tax=Mesorhizobium sp. M3A.F.Ca.ET.175.01.1.1 TaxID=2563945 RepID=UPI001FDF18FE